MYKALISFCGKVNMTMGEVGEIPDKTLADDLLRAGYIVPVKDEKPAEAKAEEKKPQKTRRGGKKNEQNNG